jgi:hypothetical protein
MPEELEDMLKVQSYDALAADIRCDATEGKDMVMNQDTHI